METVFCFLVFLGLIVLSSLLVLAATALSSPGRVSRLLTLRGAAMVLAALSACALIANRPAAARSGLLHPS